MNAFNGWSLHGAANAQRERRGRQRERRLPS